MSNGGGKNSEKTLINYNKDHLEGQGLNSIAMPPDWWQKIPALKCSVLIPYSRHKIERSKQ